MGYLFHLGVLVGAMAFLYCISVAKIAGITQWRGLDAAPRETEGQTEGQTAGQTEGQTDKQTDKQIPMKHMQ